MEHENVMVNDGQVTLVGFGHAAKIVHNPVTGDQKSRNPAHQLDAANIKVELAVSNPQSDIASIYQIMKTLILDEIH